MNECKDCKFYCKLQKRTSQAGTGECYLYPPEIIAPTPGSWTVQFKRPEVFAGDFCIFFDKEKKNEKMQRL